jgi:FimV-like protein
MRVLARQILALLLIGCAGVAVGQEAPELPPIPVSTEEQSAATTTYRTGSGETRIVRSGETLMSIARDWSTQTGTSLAQTMISIYRTNPEAFGRDMSDMQRGATLRLPTAEAIRSVPAGEATAEVSRELGIWRTQNAPRLRLVAPPTDAQQLDTPAPARAPPVAAPAVVTPAPRSLPQSPPSGTSVVESPVSLPTTTIESLEERLLLIEQQLAENRKLLEQRSQELRALQQRAAQAESWQSTLASLWWLSPIFIVLTLVLAIALWWRGRRTVEPAHAPVQQAAAAAPNPPSPGLVRSEPEFGPPIVAAKPVPQIKASEIDDVLLQPLAPSLDPLDLEGDPPPLNDATSMIDLARAYIEMGDYTAALGELQSALKVGDEAQRIEALRLLDSLPKS